MVNLENLDQEVAERLLNIEESEWGDIYLELNDYARFKVERLPYIKGGGELPLGYKAEDMVNEAITRLFDGRRKWDPEEDPGLSDFLKSVVSSIISAKLEEAGYKHKDGTQLEDFHHLFSQDETDYNDCFEALKDILENESSDDEELENVRVAIEDNMKAVEISEFFGISINKVYTLTRKLRRRISEKMKKHPCNEHWSQLGF